MSARSERDARSLDENYRCSPTESAPCGGGSFAAGLGAFIGEELLAAGAAFAMLRSKLNRFAQAIHRRWATVGAATNIPSTTRGVSRITGDQPPCRVVPRGSCTRYIHAILKTTAKVSMCNFVPRCATWSLSEPYHDLWKIKKRFCGYEHRDNIILWAKSCAATK